jgi:hypothetical protein
LAAWCDRIVRVLLRAPGAAANGRGAETARRRRRFVAAITTRRLLEFVAYDNTRPTHAASTIGTGRIARFPRLRATFSATDKGELMLRDNAGKTAAVFLRNGAAIGACAWAREPRSISAVPPAGPTLTGVKWSL